MFRPCIDLHEGKVKQIVGGTLGDAGLRTNFVSEKSAAWFAELYRRDALFGGHVIQSFSIAMLWGLFVATYSSVFICSPILIYLGVRTDAQRAADAANPGAAGAAKAGA